MAVDADDWIPLAGTRRIARLSRSFSGWFDLLLVPFQWAAFAYSDGGEASVNLVSGRLTFGRFDIPFSDIVRARTDMDAAFPENTDLHLATVRGAGFAVQLHNGIEPIIPEETRLILLEILPMTAIEQPVDPFDPTGKRASAFLSRDAAVELLRDWSPQ